MKLVVELAGIRERFPHGRKSARKKWYSLAANNPKRIKYADMIAMGVKLILMTFLSRVIDVDGNVVLALTLLIAVDFITGVHRAWKHGGPHSITSRGLRRTFDKVASYSVWICVAMIAGNVCGHDEGLPEWSRSLLLMLPRVSLACVIIIEAASIVENFTNRPFGDLLISLTGPLRLLLRTKTDLERLNDPKAQSNDSQSKSELE